MRSERYAPQGLHIGDVSVGGIDAQAMQEPASPRTIARNARRRRIMILRNKKTLSRHIGWLFVYVLLCVIC